MVKSGTHITKHTRYILTIIFEKEGFYEENRRQIIFYLSLFESLSSSRLIFFSASANLFPSFTYLNST